MYKQNKRNGKNRNKKEYVIEMKQGGEKRKKEKHKCEGEKMAVIEIGQQLWNSTKVFCGQYGTMGPYTSCTRSSTASLLWH